MDLNNSTEIILSNNKTNYNNAREEAYKLEVELETIEKKYNEQILEIIKKAQKSFYQKYGSKIQSLDDLQDYIDSEQSKGQRQLKRKLQNLFIQSDGSMNDDNELEFKNTAQELLNNYKNEYHPKDNYQSRRDKEAQSLKKLVLGNNNIW